MPRRPVVVQVDRVPIKSLLTEKGADASDVVGQLLDAYAKGGLLFEALTQLGSFELCTPLSVEHLRFYRVLDLKGNPPDYRLEEIVKPI
jgi:hypothetical protein